MSTHPIPTLAEMQGWPEVPSIAHFCSLFKTHFDLIEFEIEELETALMCQHNSEDIFSSSTLIERLVVRLLAGCLPMFAPNIHEGNFSAYLIRLLRSKEEEAEEDGHPINFVNPFETGEVDEWSELSVKDQVKVLHQLTEMRLQVDDASGKLRDLDPESMRVEPLGVDSDNVILWYFYGTRLYREVRKNKPKKPKKPKDGTEKTEEVVEQEEKVVEAPGWYLSCNSEGEWNDLVMKYKKSKKKQDKELYEILSENFLPDIIKMFKDQEREEQIKLMMLNKRSSSRLDRKREDKERDFTERMNEEKRRDDERRAEVAKKAQIAKENKQRGREVRANKRGTKEAWMTRETVLLANRKRVVEEVDKEEESLEHNYTKRRNPAMREWERLHSAESEESDGHARNLRF